MKTVITTGVVVSLGCWFALAVTARVAEPSSVSKTIVRDRGGVYLGKEGVVMQDKQNTCGLAALKMILNTYGKSVTINDLEKESNPSGDGWSMQSLKGLAEQHGLYVEGWRLNAESLCRDRFPAILYVEKHHFVVADSVDAGGFVFVRDPAIGRMKIHSHALSKIWTGETLVFGEGRVPMK